MAEAKLRRIRQLLAKLTRVMDEAEEKTLQEEGCIGYHGHPLPPNGPCKTCPHQDLCKRVIAKDRLKPVVESFLRAEAILKGEA